MFLWSFNEVQISIAPLFSIELLSSPNFSRFVRDFNTLARFKAPATPMLFMWSHSSFKFNSLSKDGAKLFIPIGPIVLSSRESTSRLHKRLSFEDNNSISSGPMLDFHSFSTFTLSKKGRTSSRLFIGYFLKETKSKFTVSVEYSLVQQTSLYTSLSFRCINILFAL